LTFRLERMTSPPAGTIPAVSPPDRNRRPRGDSRTMQEKTPKHVDDQEAPEPERLITPQEASGESLQELDEPPQAEGDRKSVEEDLDTRSD
jgi:hypothetical protein